MGSSGKNKAASKKMPSIQKVKRTVSPQQKMAVSSAPNSGGVTKSKVIQQKLFPVGSKRQQSASANSIADVPTSPSDQEVESAIRTSSRKSAPVVEIVS